MERKVWIGKWLQAVMEKTVWDKPPIQMWSASRLLLWYLKWYMTKTAKYVVLKLTYASMPSSGCPLSWNNVFLPVFSFKFNSNAAQIFLGEIWMKTQGKSASFEILQCHILPVERCCSWGWIEAWPATLNAWIFGPQRNTNESEPTQAQCRTISLTRPTP